MSQEIESPDADAPLVLDSDEEDAELTNDAVVQAIDMAPASGKPTADRLEWWYSQMSVERADLVGQLGGSCGVSLVNAETLLMRLSRDPAFATDLDGEPQFLRVVFFVERFLHSFNECNARTRLIFFNCLRPFLSLYSATLTVLRDCFLLLCEASNLDFAVFDSWNDNQFLVNTAEWQPPFILLDDCMEFEPPPQDEESVLLPEQVHNYRVLPLALMQHCTAAQLHIALLSDLERRGRKIYAFTVAPHEATVTGLPAAAAYMTREVMAVAERTQQYPEQSIISLYEEVAEKIGEGVFLRDVIYGRVLFRNIQEEKDEEQAAVLTVLSYTALITTAIQRQLNLDERSFADLYDMEALQGTELYNTISGFLSFLIDEVAHPLNILAKEVRNGRTGKHFQKHLEGALGEEVADFIDARLYTAVLCLAAEEALETNDFCIRGSFFGLTQGAIDGLELLRKAFDNDSLPIFPLNLLPLKPAVSAASEVLKNRTRNTSPEQLAEIWPVSSKFMDTLFTEDDSPQVTIIQDAPPNDFEEYNFTNAALQTWKPSYMLDVANLFLSSVTHEKVRDLLVDEKRLERFEGAAKEKMRQRLLRKALQKGAYREHKFAISVAGSSQFHHAIVVARKGTHVWDVNGAFALESGDVPGTATLPAARKAKVVKQTNKSAEPLPKAVAKKKLSKAEEIILKNKEAQKQKALKLDQDRLNPVVDQITKVGHKATSPAALFSKLLDITEGLQRVNEDIATFKALDSLLKLPESRLRALIAAVQMLHAALGRNFKLNKMPESHQVQLHKLICYVFHFIHTIFIKYKEFLAVSDIQVMQTALLGLGFKNSARSLYENWAEYFWKNADAAAAAAPPGTKKRSDTEKEQKKLRQIVDAARVIPKNVPVFPFGVPEGREVESQLEFMGHQMERSLGSKSDPRVKFKPDAWQRRLLDVIDDHRSALVCAPTGCGKTFLCYYAMEKVLSYDDEAVVVFVCPSKALVAQVGLEVAARFRSKEFSPFCSTVLDGLLLRERANSVLNCQILLTLPDLFEMLLMSANHRDWVRRIKYVIMDEIHCIGESDEIGRAWERVVQLIPCPFIALSATVGNPDSFHDWLTRAHVSSECERADGKLAIESIHFSERFADLTACVYSPDLSLGYEDLKSKEVAEPLVQALSEYARVSEDSTTADSVGGSTDGRTVKIQGGLFPLNAFSCLRYYEVKNVGITSDFYAPSSDMLSAYTVLTGVLRAYYEDTGIELSEDQQENYRYLFNELSPSCFFGTTPSITKRQYRFYLGAFKNHLNTLVKTEVITRKAFDLMVLGLQTGPASGGAATLRGYIWDVPPQAVIEKQKFIPQMNEATGAIDTGANLALVLGRSKTTDTYHTMHHLLQFCRVLRRNGLLPALMFNFSRSEVVRLGQMLLTALQEGQYAKYYGTVEATEQTKRLNKERKDKYKALLKHREMLEKMKSLSKEQKEAQGLTTESIEAELAEALPPPPGDVAEGYDPQFNFRDRRVWGKDHEEIEQLIRDAERCFHDKKEGIQWAEGLRRGFGVHHSGMPRRYRVAVEALVRKAYLMIVFSTETLSIGINMPCKSTVFVGDSLMLTPLLYRQTSGRAGRRGYDSFGHVIYWELSFTKIRRLSSAPLPVISGEFTVTPTLALRTFQLLHTAETLRLETLMGSVKKSVAEQKQETEVLASNMASLTSSVLRLYRAPLFSVASANVSVDEAAEERQSLVMRNAFRFAVDFLRRQELVDKDTACIGLAGLASRLYELEPCNLAINGVLLQGALHAALSDKAGPAQNEVLQIDANIATTDPIVKDSRFEPWILRRVLSVWCYCVASMRLHYNAVQRSRFNPSYQPFLAPLSCEIAEAVDKMRVSAMRNAVDYVATLYRAVAATTTDVENDERKLPLSQVDFNRPGGAGIDPASSLAATLRVINVVSKAQSPFASIRGRSDYAVSSPQELTLSAPACVHFESSMVPSVFWKSVNFGGREVPLLSNYAIDFFSYGSLVHAVKECGAEANSIWYQLTALLNVLEASADFVSAIAPGDVLAEALKVLHGRMTGLQRGEAA